ncbi:tyrosine-type recombinase/integrase [Roseibacterium beibuensis]|uniref:Tyrosine-type recombinase/integrase n=1 Tax=[Roseibacterium] beibuensis TaxID=1193142 RepID=A0ABP9LCR4_9RHOB|nr:tyrosine-type recombinase/integrase [Roseibacterium beibuensis]MCS6624382.1 tyrosine-type recombinase/integrase [Roseibacterium beibuensis]
MRGLWIHPRSGLPYFRSRKGGQLRLVPLPADLPHDHPDFIAAWSAAAREVGPEKAFAGGTLGSTWAAVLASDAVDRVSATYRGILVRHSARIVEKAGDVKATAIQPKHVRADIATATDKPARRKAWRFWAAYCIERGWIETDPTQGVRVKSAPTTGHPTWSPDDIAAFRARYAIGTTPRAIMELAYWTGARRGDVVRIGAQHVGRDGVLSFTQGKTGQPAFVPWTCPLPAWAAHMEPDRQTCLAAIAHMRGDLTFLSTAQGRPRSDKAAGQVVSQAARAIDLPLSLHGLRKARAVALAEAGASPSRIGAWTGHATLTEIAHYTREMDRRRAVQG